MERQGIVWKLFETLLTFSNKLNSYFALSYHLLLQFEELKFFFPSWNLSHGQKIYDSLRLCTLVCILHFLWNQQESNFFGIAHQYRLLITKIFQDQKYAYSPRQYLHWRKYDWEDFCNSRALSSSHNCLKIFLALSCFLLL